jgi:hypothetical protein
MSEWNGNCHRCGSPATGHIMSMFNHDLICFPCKDAERKRPDYHQAEAKDLREYAGRLRSKGMPVQADTVEEAAELMDYIERVETQ